MRLVRQPRYLSHLTLRDAVGDKDTHGLDNIECVQLADCTAS